MKLKPYPEYRDSGIPWLGGIPAHWECSNLRRIARVQLSNVDKHSLEGEVPVRLCNYTDVYYRRYITPDIRFMQATALPREIRKFELRQGDVLITKDSESWTDIAVPTYVIRDLPGVLCGYHLAHIRPYPAAIWGEYLLRAFEAEPIAYQFRVAASGVTRFALSGADIAAGIFPVPPLEEQRAITLFLSAVDRRINRLIRAKRRMIELLNEQKQAIIHRAVTRGLDPNVRLKPSGIDWLGDVPEHWEVIKFSRIISDGPRNGISPAVDSNGSIESFSISAVRNGRVEVGERDKKYVAGDGRSLGAVFSLRKGDILLVRGNGNIRLVGKAGCVEEDMPGRVYPDLLMRVRVTSKVLPRFIVEVLNDRIIRSQIETAARTTVGTYKVNSQQVRQLWLAVPPLPEQQHILTWLNVATHDLDTTLMRLTREVELLNEYRTRLIADVVTGKLDVRGVELPALEELGELDDLGADADVADDELTEAGLPEDDE